MKTGSIFDYDDYKKYLNDVFDTRKRGEKNALAQAMGCQSAYVSQVLNGSAHFSLEQAEVINRFFAHSKEESHFFFVMLSKDRAGSKNLKNYFSDQMEQALKKQLFLKDRLQIKNTLSSDDQAKYYSSWHFAAVHILLTIPEFQTRDAISERLKISKTKVAEILEFLVSSGLAVRKQNQYEVGTARIHLGADSPLISKHHANWKIQALASLDHQNFEDLHYSSVVTLSREDILKIKSILVKAIEQAKNSIKISNPETLCSFCLDFYEI